MCDYSLHHVKTRPAKVSDKLTTRNFGTGTRGFSASEDAKMRRGRCVVVVFKAPHFPRNWGLIQGAPPGDARRRRPAHRLPF